VLKMTPGPRRDLAAVADALVAPCKGVLAADESTVTMSARLRAAGVPASRDSRRAYREMLVTTPGLGDGISGIILSAETFGQRLADGTPFPAAISQRGMLTGIKVDAGTRPLPGSAAETITEGLDGLPPRLADYAARGAAFAKWRAVLRIGDGTPSMAAIRANADALARYAAACQHAGLVPIVEPEVLMSGSHSLGQCELATSAVLLQVAAALQDYGVAMDAVVLKPSMALPGSDCGQQASPAEVAQATLATLAAIPVTLAGVAFLSGGQPPARATVNLAALQLLPHIWPLTFSFGRALVAPALTAWRTAGYAAGQQALARRVAMNVAALAGQYRPEHERLPAPETG
jgi:fructose-bisphosphate aldolase class I